MTTETQIANIALSWMGQSLINSLSDSQNEARVMNANYAVSRDKVVGEHAWSFALRREVLTPLAAVPVFGDGNQFQIPSDVLRVYRVYRPSSNLQTSELQSARWVREGDKIVSPELTVWAHFIIRVTNTNLFNASFAQALAARLAADTCMTFTENRLLFEQLEAMYSEKLADALASDGSQGRTEVMRSTRLTGARKR